MQPYRRYLIALGAALCAHAALAGDADDPAWRTGRDEHASSARLQLVASFDHQVTGVTVAPDGRMFVSFPRWTEDAPLSVAEVGSSGDLKPYPDAEWNTWRNARRDEVTPADHWVCVQSVVADARGNLWVIDPGAPAQSLIVPGAPKLVRIDLASNRVARTYAFGESIAPQGSFLNDVRIGPDARTAYITDSGVRGAIVVVDIESGVARRVLDGDPSTQVDKSVTVTANGKPLQQTDGRRVSFAADGIALTPDGRYLYWQAVKGKTLYRIATDALQNAQLGADQIASRVEAVGVDGPADGLWIDPRGRLYVSSVEHHAIRMRQGERFATLVRDCQLIWPDTFSEGPDGTIYVTDSRIPEMSWFQPQHAAALPTRLYAIRK